MSEPESLIVFPCDFPIKVMGRQDENFESHVLGLISNHVSDQAGLDVSRRPSSNGNFIAVTVTFTATSRAQSASRVEGFSRPSATIAS